MAKSTKPSADVNSEHWAEQVLNWIDDIETFARELRTALPRHSWSDDFKVVNIFHVPGRSLKMLGCFYEDNRQTAIVLIKFYSLADYKAAAEQAKASAKNSANIGLLPNYSAIVYLFPEDPGLPELVNMLDLKKVGKILGQPPHSLSDASWKMMSYQEGKRCTLRYQFAGDSQAYIGKIQNANEIGKSHDRLTRLWEHPDRRFNMSRPIAYDPALQARWETFCAGISMEEALGQNGLEPLVRLITEQLVKLHEFAVPDLSSITADSMLNKIERKILRRLNITTPESAIRAEAIFKKLQQTVGWTENCPDVTLHGDFHIANFLLDKDNLVFIDLDDLSTGNPCFDLAMFASRLLLRNLHHDDRLTETLRITATLPELYSNLSGRPIRPETFAWYMAALLLGRQVRICMREDVPDRNKMIDQLLNWARDCLDNARFIGGNFL